MARADSLSILQVSPHPWEARHEINELIAQAGPEEAAAIVELLGSGRRISVDSENLKILPQGEFYELWFVGPGDSDTDPNRISAGTFHPDENGVTTVELHAAVDPEKFPGLEITAEPGDGNPDPTGPVVVSYDD